jgi:NAD(P)-dependent dehydrogenase (short-subunit alcohol dehydrogenase family)
MSTSAGQPDASLRRRKWLVVGASRGGIGAAIAQAAASAGDQVLITGAEPEPLTMPDGVHDYLQLQITDREAVRALAARYEHLDVLVNCAAIARRDEEWDVEMFRRVIEINLIAGFDLVTALRPALKQACGNVINIASMYSTFGSPRVPAYGASKAAVAQLTRSLAGEFAQDRIRVNAIAPGFIVTEQSARGRADKTHYESVIARTPAGRWGLPEDLAGAAMFLASDAASFVTGHTLVVDGGYSIV